MSPMSSTNVLSSNLLYGTKHQRELGLSGQMPLLLTSVPNYPERPDQPECQYFIKTGSCKFGLSCKYHHPKERIAPLATSTLGPLGLPLRPGQAVCTFYSLYGICKFGPTCKYDHPLAGYSYNYSFSMPNLSISDPSFFYHERNSPLVHSSESSPSKSSRLPDKISKSDIGNDKQENSDTKVMEDPSQEATSPTSTGSQSV